mmetsp:Transcript_82596/g.114157  ORF Transcript_82596/g.114157 Transcript_82596/m.114157 type:complete len:220 (-) Transcript_82596:27-686(-)
MYASMALSELMGDAKQLSKGHKVEAYANSWGVNSRDDFIEFRLLSVIDMELETEVVQQDYYSYLDTFSWQNSFRMNWTGVLTIELFDFWYQKFMLDYNLFSFEPLSLEWHTLDWTAEDENYKMDQEYLLCTGIYSNARALNYRTTATANFKRCVASLADNFMNNKSTVDIYCNYDQYNEYDIYTGGDTNYEGEYWKKSWAEVCIPNWFDWGYTYDPYYY